MTMQQQIETLAHENRQLDLRIAFLEQWKDGAKPWWQSKGIMGPMASLGTKVAALILFMKGVPPEVTLAVLGSGGVADVVGAVGRATAKGGITK